MRQQDKVFTCLLLLLLGFVVAVAWALPWLDELAGRWSR